MFLGVRELVNYLLTVSTPLFSYSTLDALVDALRHQISVLCEYLLCQLQTGAGADSGRETATSRARRTRAKEAAQSTIE